MEASQSPSMQGALLLGLHKAPVKEGALEGP